MGIFRRKKDETIAQLVRSIGNTILSVGIFYTGLAAVAFIAAFIDGDSADTRSLILAAVLLLPLTVFWIYAGVRIKKLYSKLQAAKSMLAAVIVTAIIYFVLNVAETALGGMNIGVLIIGAFTAYLLWSFYNLQARIKFAS